MRPVIPLPQKPAPAPRPAGLLALLREAIILLAGGGLTWTDTEKRRGRYS